MNVEVVSKNNSDDTRRKRNGMAITILQVRHGGHGNSSQTGSGSESFEAPWQVMLYTEDKAVAVCYVSRLCCSASISLLVIRLRQPPVGGRVARNRSKLLGK